jgi:hypothetical protein
MTEPYISRSLSRGHFYLHPIMNLSAKLEIPETKGKVSKKPNSFTSFSNVKPWIAKLRKLELNNDRPYISGNRAQGLFWST